jgi:hypothetical protein
MHRGTGTPYLPILACGTHMQVKTDIFKNSKHFYSPYSNEILDIKVLEYKEYFTHIDLWRILKNSQDI